MSGLFKNLQPYNPSWKNHGTGGGTSFTLDVPSTTNATLLTIGGVLQLAGTDYTVSGTTVTTTSSVASGVEVISAVLYDLGSVTTPGAGTVNFDALSFTSQAQGDLLYRGASSWARLAAGTSGHVLQSGGSGGNPSWVAPAGGAWSLISATTLSSDANYSFTGFNASTYDAYVFVLINVIPATDAVHIHMTTSSDGGSSYDSGASDYNWLMARNKDMVSDGGDGGDADADDAHIALIGDNSGAANVIGSDSDEHGVSGQIWLYDPASTKNTHGTYDLMYQSTTPENLVNIAKGGFARMSAADVDAIRIEFSSGNIESGQINAYGVKNS